MVRLRLEVILRQMVEVVGPTLHPAQEVVMGPLDKVDRHLVVMGHLEGPVFVPVALVAAVEMVQRILVVEV